MGGHANLVQYFGDGQFVTVHAGVEQVLFLSAGCFEHPGGKDTFVKGLDEIVGKALVQQLLYHLLALERAGNEKRGVALACGVVALLDRQRVQPGHKGVQQHYLRANRQHLLQNFISILFHNGHFHALLLQRLTTGFCDLSTGIRHQESHFIHGCFLQCVQFP